MRLSKKKASMMSKKHDCNRDWGKGMACVGRTKQCTIVPSNHFGPIPGIPVGSLWKFRVQVSKFYVEKHHSNKLLLFIARYTTEGHYFK